MRLKFRYISVCYSSLPAAVFYQNGICRSLRSKPAHASAIWARIGGRQIVFCRRQIPLTFSYIPGHKSYNPWKLYIPEVGPRVKRGENKLAGNKKRQILMPLFNHRAQVGFLTIKFPDDDRNHPKLKSSIFTQNNNIHNYDC